MSAVPGTYSIRSRSPPVPTTTPWARDRSTRPATAALRSMSSWTFAARAVGVIDPSDDPGRGHHGHVGPHPLASALVDGQRAEVRAGAARDDRRGDGGQLRRTLEIQESLERPGLLGQGTLLLQLNLQLAHSGAQPLVLQADVLQRQYCCQRSLVPVTRPVATRWSSATAPKYGTSSIGTPVRVVTWAEISTSCASTTAVNNQPVR